jgi:hypothetical protein
MAGGGWNPFHPKCGSMGILHSMNMKRIIRLLVAARCKFPAPNIECRLGDIRTEMSDGSFDNVTRGAGIEYFTPKQIAGILVAIKVRLAPGRILSGYSILTPVIEVS